MVGYRERMDYFENHCYWLIRLALLYNGLWPYTDRKIRFILSSFTTFGLTTTLLSGLLKFITLFPSIESIIYVLGLLSIFVITFLGNFSIFFKMAEIKKIWEHIESDWKKLEKINKISIVKRYAYKSNLLSLYIIILASIYCVFLLLDTFLPYALQIMKSTRQPDLFKLPISVEFFGKYDLLLTSVAFLFILKLGMLTATLISEFIIFVHHACLLFLLTGDILEQGFTNIKIQNNTADKDIILYKAIVESVKYHTNAIRFSKMIEDVYTIECFYVMIGVIAMLTSNLLRFILMTLSHTVFPMIASFFYLFCVVGIAFIVTHIGQLLIDHSLDVFNKVCTVPWYTASLKSQKLLLLILTRSKKQSCITHGKMAILAHTLFTTLLNSGISFTTAFISMR